MDTPIVEGTEWSSYFPMDDLPPPYDNFTKETPTENAPTQRSTFFPLIKNPDPTKDTGYTDVLANHGVHVAWPGFIYEPFHTMQEMWDNPKLPSEDPQVGEKTLSLAGTFVGGLPFTPKNAVGTFGGRLGAASMEQGGVSAPKRALELAQHMEAGGVTEAMASRRATQALAENGLDFGAVVKGPDGHWRFEIDDSKMRLTDKAQQEIATNGRVEGLLGDLLDHPRLFQAYPDAAFIPISEFIIKPNIFEGGGYLPSTGAIRVKGRDTEEFMGILAHELQHFIQIKEGFSPGTNPKADWIQGEYGALGGISQQREAAAALSGEIEKLQKKLTRIKDPARKEELSALIREKQAQHREILPKLPNDGNSFYRAVAGEREAKIVQERQGMSTEQRLSASGSDILASDIVLRPGLQPDGSMANLGRQPKASPKQYVTKSGTKYELMQNSADPTDYRVYVGDKVAGRIYFEKNGDGIPGHSIQLIDLNKEFQRKGIGEAIYRTFQARYGDNFVPSHSLEKGTYEIWKKINPDLLEAGKYKYEGDTGQYAGTYTRTDDKFSSYDFSKSKRRIGVDLGDAPRQGVLDLTPPYSKPAKDVQSWYESHIKKGGDPTQAYPEGLDPSLPPTSHRERGSGREKPIDKETSALMDKKVKDTVGILERELKGDAPGLRYEVSGDKSSRYIDVYNDKDLLVKLRVSNHAATSLDTLSIDPVSRNTPNTFVDVIRYELGLDDTPPKVGWSFMVGRPVRQVLKAQAEGLDVFPHNRQIGGMGEYVRGGYKDSGRPYAVESHTVGRDIQWAFPEAAE